MFPTRIQYPLHIADTSTGRRPTYTSPPSPAPPMPDHTPSKSPPAAAPHHRPRNTRQLSLSTARTTKTSSPHFHPSPSGTRTSQTSHSKTLHHPPQTYTSPPTSCRHTYHLYTSLISYPANLYPNTCSRCRTRTSPSAPSRTTPRRTAYTPNSSPTPCYTSLARTANTSATHHRGTRHPRTSPARERRAISPEMR